ncbi:MAG: alpha/beta hydrolase [Anaerolineae bacterium]|nr:alpha/beta hydrolase [Anaerolineae bacterium]
MTIPPAEHNLRAGLRITRVLSAYLPLRLARWVEKRSAVRVSLPQGVRHEVVSAYGVRCEWLLPEDYHKDRVLLYLHGGGFVYGLTVVHRQMVAHLAQATGISTLLVDYRLAPEHPFPAALDDCVSAYRWLLKQGFAAQDIVIAGDSAGGNLTIATLMKLRDSGDPLPAAAACLSPVTDMTERDGQFETVYDPVLHPRAARTFNHAYVAGGDARNPLISPAFGDWRGLPPLLIHAGEDEILRQDAEQSEASARAAGVDVHLEIYPRMWHVWQINLSLPQARQSLADIARFLKAHLAEKQST